MTANMKIGISMRGLNQGSHAISNIIYYLTQNIIQLVPGKHEVFLYFNETNLASQFNSATKTRGINIKNRLIWDQVWLPLALSRDGIDISLFMKGTMPILLPCKGAVIFHDLGYYDAQLKPYKFFETLYMKRMMALAGKKAAVIYTDSEFTKNEAIKILGIQDRKIKVCYPNCSPIFTPVADEAAISRVKALYNLPSPFIFSPITLSPRKNLDRILHAFETVKDCLPHHLVITGGRSWGVRRPEKRIKSGLNGRVHILGTVPGDDMPALYSLAQLTLYPSLIEGFGIPILEAFNCGCPVLTSNISAMPEVAGDAAYLVNPYDPSQIAEGMLRLVKDEDLRRSFIRKGFDRAKIFSWENAALTILDGILD
jgi:glycosyltransferase involved in cell wall biosynthesis